MYHPAICLERLRKSMGKKNTAGLQQRSEHHISPAQSRSAIDSIMTFGGKDYKLVKFKKIKLSL
jgi:hypothetical protein